MTWELTSDDNEDYAQQNSDDDGEDGSDSPVPSPFDDKPIFEDNNE